MANLNIAYSYVSLDKAGALLGVSVSDLIHAGAFDQVQICVNIYARAVGMRMSRITVFLDGDNSEIDIDSNAEVQTNGSLFIDWLTRLKINPMPAGVFEVSQDDLRLFELPEHQSIEMVDATKSDERGLWEVDFEPFVNVARSDLVMLTTEIERIQKSGGVDIKASEKLVSSRERTSYLNIIGAMLAQLTSGKANDTTVITKAISDHGKKQGISQRKLQEVFAAAKRSLSAN